MRKRTIIDFKIDKNVPVPARSKPHTEIGDAIGKMKPTDSVFFKTEKEAQRFAQNLHFHNRGTTMGVCKRPVKGGWRVWRTATKMRVVKKK